MGEVYRARDTRLDRDVAIKVLTAASTNDIGALGRFEREAKAVAAISHPNILTIFDFGAHEGVAYAAMELLDGESLRERLTSGPLPERKAIDIAVQVARGLAAAHDIGLAHRDLKPDNVFLLRDGQVKILDFGLARAVMLPAGDAGTVTALTYPGTVMGTVGYMAPEQVRGETTDARSDLFAFGAVLFEMLSGARAFRRDTAVETMTAILSDDPPRLSSLRAGISPALVQITAHCLEKNPLDRFQSARDVAFALSALTGTGVSSAPIRAGGRWQRLRWASVPVLVALAGAVGLLMGQRQSRPAAMLAFETKTWDPMWVSNARFGPDEQIIFSAALSGNVPELFAIRPGTVTPQPLGQKATHLLSVSSTGELAVLTHVRHLDQRLFDGTLARMTLDGTPRPWMEHVREADWSPDGASLAIIHDVDGHDQLEYPVGRIRHRGTGYLTDLRVSPDGSRIAFFEHPLFLNDEGWVKVLLPTGEVRTLAGKYWAEEGLAWSPDGRDVLFSATQRGLDYQPLIVNVAGTPTVRQRATTAGPMVVQDVSATGRLLVIRSDIRSSIRALLPGDRAERELPWRDMAFHGILGSDRQMMAFSDQGQTSGDRGSVMVRNLASGSVTRLGDGLGWGLSPDGRWAGAMDLATNDLFVYPTGPGQPVPIGRGATAKYQGRPQWFPDGKRILVCGNEAAKPQRCYEQDVVGGVPRAVTPDGIRIAQLAPDGRTMLTLSTSGEYGVWTLGSNQIVPVRGLTHDDVWVGWTEDSRALVVNAGHRVPARVERIEWTTGVRTFERDVMPTESAGVMLVDISQWLDGGRGYVYDYTRQLDALYVGQEKLKERVLTR
jgi:serine/threonine protein kinase